jgi:hypothetical protein
MSQFCTNCGSAQVAGKEFCTSCGAKLSNSTSTIEKDSRATESQVVGSSVTSSLDAAPTPTAKRSKSRTLKLVAAVVVLGGVIAGTYALGRSSIDQEKIRKAGYESGYTTGRSDGYDSGESAGYSRGYDSGKVAGCEWVFDQANYASYVTKYDIYGYGFGRFPGSVYVSKSNC